MGNASTTQTEGRDYRDTLFLPHTDFPMRAGLPKAEPQHLKRWAEMGLYDQLRQDAKGRTPFVLHDGPPYANGHLHIGHALNKVLKDIVVRSRQMSGYDANYVPGWDCHGLPIEWQVEKEFKAKGRTKRDIPAEEFRTACRNYAAKWVDIQKQEFQRLGIEGDWAHPYTTMKFESEALIVTEFLKFAEKGMVYRGSKPVMWSPVEQTALAEAEIEYHDHQSTTIWVKFPFAKGHAPNGLEQARVVIWTTTPWTIPGNRAICYGPKLSYGLYQVKSMPSDLDFTPWSKPGDQLILADELAESVRQAGLIESWERVSDVTAAQLQAARCYHPLRGFSGGYDFEVPLLSGDHVTEEAGTGFVHTAPGHGQEDYFAWLEHGLSQDDIPYTVGPDGSFTEEAPGFTGEKVIVTEGKKTGRDGGANKAVIEQLIAHYALLARGRLTHSYPHSWRSKAPVIFRNTPQWFIRLGEKGDGTLRDTALQEIDKTSFYPESGRKRIQAMVEGRPDWLVSRQRAWGVPITLFVDKDSGEPLLDPEVNERIINAIRESGAGAWFETAAEVFLDNRYDAAQYERVDDILDVWFDSGSTHAFVLDAREDLSSPADLYLEGSDQHRGWFQASLLESCGTRGHAPFKAVLTHGFVLDEKNLKMSKSLGNVVDPAQVMQQYGADILRIWVARSDYAEDLRIGKEILASAADGYRKLRNTLRYLLGAVSDYHDTEEIDKSNMPELEQFILHRLTQVSAAVADAYTQYDFKTAWREVFDFCNHDLSAFFLDIRKDSLYCDHAENPKRQAARQVMALCLDNIMRWLAPICPFTMEETFLARYPEQSDGSVHLLQFMSVPEQWKNENLAAKWTEISKVRSVITGALEIERREKRIGSSLAAAPIVYIQDSALYDLLSSIDMAELAITSDLTLENAVAPDGTFQIDDVDGVAVAPALADGGKCPRCWRILPEVDSAESLCQRCETVVAKHDRQDSA
ncbi:MAG: isoleucine--tRNA ligase [bacterium]